VKTNRDQRDAILEAQVEAALGGVQAKNRTGRGDRPRYLYNKTSTRVHAFGSKLDLSK
jgi:hypothetical protein